MKRSGKRPLPPHVLEAVEAKAAARRLDERAFFWAEVRAAEAGVGGARSHGRCLPDTLEDVFPELLHRPDASPRDEDGSAGGDDGGLSTMRRLAEAYDDVPVTVEDPLAAAGDPVTPLPAGPEGVAALEASLRNVKRGDGRAREEREGTVPVHVPHAGSEAHRPAGARGQGHHRERGDRQR